MRPALETSQGGAAQVSDALDPPGFARVFTDSAVVRPRHTTVTRIPSRSRTKIERLGTHLYEESCSDGRLGARGGGNARLDRLARLRAAPGGQGAHHSPARGAALAGAAGGRQRAVHVSHAVPEHDSRRGRSAVPGRSRPRTPYQ